MAIRILQIVTQMERNGLETLIMNYYRNIDRTQVQFDFLVHRQERKDYDDEIEALGGIIYRMPRLNPFSPAYYKALDDFFKQHPEYKIVHCHLDCMAGIPLLVAKKNHVPVRIAHSHNSNQTKNLKYPLKLAFKHLIPYTANRLFACGKEAGQWTFGDRKFSVLHNAIDAEKYRWNPATRSKIRDEFHIPQDAFVLGHVGRFTGQKNHHYLLNIFSAFADSEQKVYLLLVGDGPLREENEKLAEKLPNKNNIIFAGIRSDVPDLLQAMDVFVLPSLYEGLPLVMVEAQAAGLPCVISDPIPSECIITDGLVTQLPLSESVESWRQEIEAAGTKDRKNTYYEILKSGYDIHRNAEKLQRYYQKLWNAEETHS